MNSSVGTDPRTVGVGGQSSSFSGSFPSTVPFISTYLSLKATNLPSFHEDATSSSRWDRPHCQVPSKRLPFGERETHCAPDWGQLLCKPLGAASILIFSKRVKPDPAPPQPPRMQADGDRQKAHCRLVRYRQASFFSKTDQQEIPVTEMQQGEGPGIWRVHRAREMSGCSMSG